jgi:hypothetical protein
MDQVFLTKLQSSACLPFFQSSSFPNATIVPPNLPYFLVALPQLKMKAHRTIKVTELDSNDRAIQPSLKLCAFTRCEQKVEILSCRYTGLTGTNTFVTTHLEPWAALAVIQEREQIDWFPQVSVDGPEVEQDISDRIPIFVAG